MLARRLINLTQLSSPFMSNPNHQRFYLCFGSCGPGPTSSLDYTWVQYKLMKARLIKPSCGLHNLCVGNLNFLFSDLLLNLRTALFLNVTLICVFGTAEIRRTKRDLKGIISVKNSPLLMLADNLFETVI